MLAKYHRIPYSEVEFGRLSLFTLTLIDKKKKCWSEKLISEFIWFSSFFYCRRIFTLLLLVIYSNGAKYVPCESVAVGTRGWFTCSMQDATVIGGLDFKISSARDERVQEILFNRNRKISFLPLDTSKNFPNLTGYSARNCSIRNVRKENFHNLNALKGIYLDNNQIETIFSETFEGLISLQEIFLGKVRT